MHLLGKKPLLFPAIFVIAAGEFYLDIITPLDVSNWIWYFIPLFLSVYVGQRYFPYLLVNLFSFLILIGIHLSPPGVNRDIVLVGRLAGICALWLMAVLIVRRKDLEASLRQTERALKTVIKCDEVLVRATSERALLHDVCQLIVDKGGYRLAWVGLREADAEKSVSVAAYAGCNEGYLDSLRITWADCERGRGPVGTALRTGQRVICQNFLADPQTAPWHRKATERGFQSVISLPLAIGGKVFGVLSVYAGEENAFHDEEIQLLCELAGDLAYGVQAQRTRVEQQRADAELKQERNLLRTLIDSIPDSIYARDTANRFVLGNKTLAQRLGAASPAELIGKNDADFFGPELSASIGEIDREVLAGRPVINMEQNLVFPDGKRRTLLVNKVPLFDDRGAVTGLVGIGRDITDRKRAEEKIREQAELLNRAHDAITIRDLDGRIRYWNLGAQRVYGWTSAEAVGKNSHELLGLDPGKMAEARRHLLKKGFWNGELTAHRKDGGEVLIETSWTLVRDDDGLPKSVFAFSVDITEQRQLEHQAARNQRIESLGTLSSGVAHDLNNILTPIMVSIGLLKEQAHDPMLGRLIAGLEASTRRGAQLVKQILTFGRGVKGERVPIRLCDSIREVQQLIQETFPKTIQMEIKVPVNLWLVNGDPTQIHQVLLNLAINARDAMPNGGKLSFTCKNTIVDAAGAANDSEVQPGAYVFIQVSDTGTGMTRKVIERIFDPFFSTKPTGQGTGLGLSTTLGIVKSHGGIINVWSEPGKGSAFKIFLPAQNFGEPAEPETGGGKTLPRGHNELILLVDDEEAICATAKKILERHGYRVITAANGAEAVSVYTARHSEINVVITDMHMPVMDGPTAITALQSVNPNVKIISSSGLNAYEDILDASGFGVRHFVPKPYSAEKMLCTVQEVLENGNRLSLAG